MEVEKSWFSRIFTSDHRRSARHATPGLYAYYWEGTAPVGHQIQNISSTGFYLLTKERWHPGTIVTMTLQKAAVAGATPELYIAVQTKVVRLGHDGVGFSFLHPELNGAWQDEVSSSRPAGRRALERFLDQLLSEQGHITLGAPERRSWLEGRATQATSGGNAMKTLHGENGQALIITVLGMTILLGFSALAADVGIMMRTKRLTQTAADAAAIAGALEVDYGDVTSQAKGAAALNGMTDGANGATITVNNPPLNGPHAGKGNNNYVEVIASQIQPTLFMNLFGFSNLTINTRAVAYKGGSTYNCIYVLDPSAQQAMELQGSFNLNAPNCGIVVDSNASNAMNCTGSGNNGSVQAGSIGVTGAASGCNPGAITPTPMTGATPESDPLASVLPAPPDPSTLSCTAPAGGTLTGTISPPSANGTVCYSGNVYLNNVTFTSGTYVFTGNVSMGNMGSSTSPSVGTLDIVNGILSIAPSTTAVYITAPTTTSWPGIAIMQPVANKNQLQLQFGKSYGTIDGIIWAPGAQLFLQDSGGDKNGGVTLITDLIVNTLTVQTSTLKMTSYSQSTGSPLTKVALIE